MYLLGASVAMLLQGLTLQGTRSFLLEQQRDLLRSANNRHESLVADSGLIVGFILPIIRLGQLDSETRNGRFQPVEDVQVDRIESSSVDIQ